MSPRSSSMIACLEVPAAKPENPLMQIPERNRSASGPSNVISFGPERPAWM
jgi:hypothetical protein